MGELIETKAGVKTLEELRNLPVSENSTLGDSLSKKLKAREVRIMRFLLGFDRLNGQIPSKEAVAKFFKVSEKQLEWIIYGAIFRMRASAILSHFIKHNSAIKTIL